MLKRLRKLSSRRNLRTAPFDSAKGSPPAVPSTPAIEVSRSVTPVDASSGKCAVPEASVSSLATTVPATSGSHTAAPAIETTAPSEDNPSKDAQQDDRFADTWQQVNKPPAVKTGITRALDDLDCRLWLPKGGLSPTISKSIMSSAGQIATDFGLKDKIGSFMKGMPIFMDALDEVGKIHPIVQGVVIVFKAAYTLEVKRRDNDKKITALFSEMKDVMAVLLRLKDMRDDGMRITRPDGTVLKDQLRECLDSIEASVKECSNMCDTYSKKSLLSKVVHGPIWNTRLAGYVATFRDHRGKLEFTLVARTGLGVDEANIKLDILINFFANSLSSPEVRRLSKQYGELQAPARGHGGPHRADAKDPRVVNLVEQARRLEGARAPVPGGKSGEKEKDKSEARHLEYERVLEEKPDESVENNRELFDRNLELQMDILRDVVHEEGKWIVAAVGEQVGRGAHDRLANEDIRQLWKDMGWRGTVDTRLLVVTLRDRYTEKSILHQLDTDDEWALGCIDMKNVQPIVEAIDEDASGFLTIGELNAFTESPGKPKDWTLLTWIAYWAVGWKAVQIGYAQKIQQIATQLISLSSHVLPINRSAAWNYMSRTSLATYAFAGPFWRMNQGFEDVPERFGQYTLSQEARLRENLERIHFIVDGRSALDLVLGSGRTEKNALALLYILLERHFNILKTACRYAIANDELSEAATAIETLQDAIALRMQDLANSFQQQRFNLLNEFDVYICGMFRYFYTPSLFAEEDTWESIEVHEGDADDEVKNILNHPYSEHRSLPILDDWVYDGSLSDDLLPVDEEDLVRFPFLGSWTGKEGHGSDSTASLQSIRLWLTDDKAIIGRHWSSRGYASIKGSVETVDGVTKVELRFDFSMWSPSSLQQGPQSVPDADDSLIKFVASDAPYTTMVFNGVYSSGPRPELRGDLGWEGQPIADLPVSILYRRMDPEAFAFYHPDAIQLYSNARLRWDFAIKAVIQSVRRRFWTWTFFKNRRDQRKTFLEYEVVRLFGTPGEQRSKDEGWAVHLRECLRTVLPDDGCFYFSRMMWRWAHVAAYGTSRFFCNACSGDLVGSRLWCIDCWYSASTAGVPFDPSDSYDVCNQTTCINTKSGMEAVRSSQPPHALSHRLVLIRTHLPWPLYPSIVKKANDFGQIVEAITDSITSAATSNSRDGTTDVWYCSVCCSPLGFPFWFCLQPWSDCWDHPVCDKCIRTPTEFEFPVGRQRLNEPKSSASEHSGPDSSKSDSEAKSRPNLADVHGDHHIFLRCPEPLERDDETKTPSQLAMEKHISSMQQSLSEAIDRLGALERTVEKFIGVIPKTLD
ncbi:unnamed protein product [Peniophora sp. CBMAI 1063]|nr:unnamed protein product [Peniophora sp. CBMAI 1063]